MRVPKTKFRSEHGMNELLGATIQEFTCEADSGKTVVSLCKRYEGAFLFLSALIVKFHRTNFPSRSLVLEVSKYECTMGVLLGSFFYLL